MHNIKLTEVVNAGLLIEADNTKILIDGLHTIKKRVWSTIDDKLRDYIIYGNGEFKNINYLLFTHQHNDHFNLDITLEYIKNNKVDKLLITELKDDTLKNSSLLTEMKSAYNEVNTLLMGNVNITFFKSKHLGNKRLDINHYSFIINIKNKNILYIGDADFKNPDFQEIILKYTINIVISPLLLTNSKSGRELLSKIKPELLIINHLPNTDDDKYNYRDIVEKDLKKYGDILPQTIIFQNLYDNIVI